MGALAAPGTRPPSVLAPSALAFGAAIFDDRVPVAVRLFLILRRNLEGKGLVVPERRAAVETETGNAQAVNSTVNTSPFLPPGRLLVTQAQRPKGHP